MCIQHLDIKNLHDLIEVISQLWSKSHNHELWWRGQSIFKRHLQPKVYRGNRDHSYEKGVAVDFISKAPARYSDCPTDVPGWLFLMQHYAAPTRLLDWTESPLIALFFAVREDKYDSKPAALWALNPFALNENQANTGSIFNPIASSLADISKDDLDDPIRPMFTAVFSEENGENVTNKIVAVQPPHKDIRILAQQSVFTLHGTRKPLDQLYCESQNRERFLWKFKIPSNAKESLRLALARLGIQECSLFPDLEHLSKYLERSSVVGCDRVEQQNVS